MSNFIYYEKLEDYEEQVKKAKLCEEKDKEIERLNNIINKAIEYIEKHSSKPKTDVFGISMFLVFNGDIGELLDILKGSDK